MLRDDDERRRARKVIAMLAPAFGLQGPDPDEHRWEDDGGPPAPALAPAIEGARACGRRPSQLAHEAHGRWGKPCPQMVDLVGPCDAEPGHGGPHHYPPLQGRA